FNQAAGQIIANSNTVSGKIKIASSSLGFLGEARGDGFGGPDTTEGAVQAARRAGVLWIQSAGNYAQDHWSGLLNAPRDTAGYLDLDLADSQNIADAVELAPGGQGNVMLTWDQWPTATARVSVQVLGWNSSQNPATDQPSETYSDWDFNPATLRLNPGSAPTLDLAIANSSAPASNDYHTYYVFVQVLDATGPVRYDLDYTGDFSPSYLASPCQTGDPYCPVTAHNAAALSSGAAGSLTSPATSPYVLSVGAAYVGHAGDPNPTPVMPGQVEPFSSRGPTIDGRVKPDLIGYDGVSSNFADVESSQYDSTGTEIASTHGFYGTSAAAPHVAGAAALALAANPNLDASQLEAFLESPTVSASSTTSAALNPPTNAQGHGLLQLGPADASRVLPPAGTTYHGLTPVRIAYTVTGLGVPKGTLTAGEEVSVAVPSSVPASATSVVISLSGVNAQAGTYLSLYPNSWPGNSTLNLGSTDRNATVTAIVGLNASHAFKLRNAAGKTDALVNLLGYFDAPSNGGDGYAPVAQTRVLDTRNGIGAPRRQLAPNAEVTVDVSKAGVPADADVALIDMTAINQNRAGYLTAFPNVGFAIGTVDYGAYQRSNMALVPIVNGKFTIQNRFATADAIVDVSGYFSPSATARFVSLPAPVRVVNTATGTGGQHGPMSAVSVISVDGGGLNQVPYNASALWAGLTAVATADGYISVFPNGGAIPHTSDVGYTRGRAVPNGSIPNLSAGTATTLPGFSTVVRAGSIQLYEDLYGYFYIPAG
ncbi:MAG TPA: S8 family serine peptidase, partial [Jatrophihabitans sp.]|nr:S8 family serine peptidase [Jatrophihabitans sp.]